MEQGRLWTDLPAAEPRQRTGRPPRAASKPIQAPKPAEAAQPAAASKPARPATLPLWAPEPEPAKPPDSPPSAAASALRVRPHPGPLPKGEEARPRTPRASDPELDEAAMEEVVEWLAELGEAGGRGGEAVRRFAALFPPSTRWGEPWPPGLGADDLPSFRPDARSYAAALRDVLAGRRRVRLAGRWDAATGASAANATLTLSLAGVGDAATWTILEATGLG